MPQHKDAPNAETIFHTAVRLGAMNCLQYLLDTYPYQSDKPDMFGNTPLHLAVAYLEDDMIKLMLDKGAYVNSRNNSGDSVLHMIVLLYFDDSDFNKVNNCLQVLLNAKHIDLSPKNAFLQTPINMVIPCLEENIPWAKTFCYELAMRGLQLPAQIQQILGEQLDSHQDDVAIVSPDIISNVFNAILTDDDAELTEMFQNIEAMRRIKYQFLGSRPIAHHLASKFDANLLKLFCEQGGNILKESVDGTLALHAALARGNVEIVDIVLKSMNAAKSDIPLDLRKWSFSLLKSVLCNKERTINILEDADHTECLNKLLENNIKFKINQKDTGKHNTALDIAINNNYKDIVDALKSHGAKKASRHSKNGWC